MNDPFESMEKSREKYFNTFLDKYRNISGDKTAANSLCHTLSTAVEDVVIRKLPDSISRHMESIPFFCQKNYFKAKMLADLSKRKDFQLYKIYLTDVKSSFEWWAEHYVTEFCNRPKKPNLNSIAQQEVKNCVTIITNIVESISETLPIKEWLKKFHENLKGSIKIDPGEMQDIISETHEEIDSTLFVNVLKEKLEKQEVNVAVMSKIKDPNSILARITTLKNSPHITLCERVTGCTAQCPFCGEQCESTTPDHSPVDHFLKIHRPKCLARYTWDESNQLVFRVCPALVHPDKKFRFKNKDTNQQWVEYKVYRSIYNNWNISPESPTDAPKYWQWFVYKFLGKITSWVGAAPSDIPNSDWKGVDTVDPIKSLSEIYDVTLEDDEFTLH